MLLTRAMMNKHTVGFPLVIAAAAGLRQERAASKRRPPSRWAMVRDRWWPRISTMMDI